MISHIRSSKKKAKGAGLIEVLVAIFIFSVGMLGIAALTSAAVKYQTGNVVRGAVAASIGDITDRIRGNLTDASGFSPPGVGTTTTSVSAGYNYTATYTAQQSATIAFPTSPDCGAAVCTPAEMTNYDIANWRRDIRQKLPGGAALLQGNVANGFDVTVMWFDKDYVRGDDSAFTDTPEATRVCDASDSPNSSNARFCCPAAAQAPVGVRCYTAKVVP
jgi:type IV pilus assembly protein PilV